MPKGQGKKTMHSVMHKFKHGDLHSGSKKGPKVKSRAQAIAIGIAESKPAATMKKRKHAGRY